MESQFTQHLYEMMAQNMWGVYLCLLVAPFIQEDAAVIGAASLSLTAMVNPALIFILCAFGLIASDLWKYWLGRAARTRDWAKKFAEKPAVTKAEGLMGDKLGTSLMTVRFVPGARIAFYIAAGYFLASWLRFAVWVVLSAIVYIGVVFALFHAIGIIAGEAAKFWLPVFAIAALFLYLLVQQARTRRRSAVGESQ